MNNPFPQIYRSSLATSLEISRHLNARIRRRHWMKDKLKRGHCGKTELMKDQRRELIRRPYRFQQNK